MEQRVAKGRVAMDLKLSILTALNKLADRDTQQIAMEELLRVAENLAPNAISVYLVCLYEISPDQKSVVRREGIKLFSVLASCYGDLLSPHLHKIISTIIRRLKEPDSNVRDACADTIGMLVAHVPVPPNADGSANSLGMFTKPLFNALNEQTRNVQVGAAMCLTRAMENARDLSAGCIQRLCMRIVKFLTSPTFTAKAALLPSIASLSRAAGIGIIQNFGVLIPCMQESLQSNDWATRKAAADTFGALALSVGGPPLTNYKFSTMSLLESYRFDKVKPARESVNDAILIWKNVPDPMTSDSTDHPSSPAERSTLSTISSGSTEKTNGILRSKQLSAISVPACEKSSSTPSSVGKKKKSPTSAPEFVRKPPSRNFDNWQIDVAVPRGSPPVFTHNKENRDYLTIGSESNGEKLGRTGEILPVASTSKRRTTTEENITSMNGDAAEKWDSSQDFISRDSGALCPVTPEQQPCKLTPSGSELASIGKKLLQLEKGQSNLMDLLQGFIGSSQMNASGLESRVQRLERALDDMMFVTANPSGSRPVHPGYGSDDVNGNLHSAADRNVSKGTNDFVDRHFSSSVVKGRENGEVWNEPHVMTNGSRSYMGDSPTAAKEDLSSWRASRLGEGPSARSVWRASKDEATLAAIRLFSDPSEKISSEKNTPQKLADPNGGCSWNVWSRVMESLHSGDVNSAYEEVLCSGDELLVLRLMNRTGPIIDQLSSETANELLRTITQLLQQHTFLDCAIPWIQQVTDMIRTHGPRCLSLSVSAKRDLIALLHEAAAKDMPERWVVNVVNKMANQLASAWMVDLQQAAVV